MCAAFPGAPLRAVFIRAPVVETTGPDVEVLATVGAARADPTCWRW